MTGLVIYAMDRRSLRCIFILLLPLLLKMTVRGAETTVCNQVQTPDNAPCTDLCKSESDSDITPCICRANQENARACQTVQDPHNWALLDLNQ